MKKHFQIGHFRSGIQIHTVMDKGHRTGCGLSISKTFKKTIDSFTTPEFMSYAHGCARCKAALLRNVDTNEVVTALVVEYMRSADDSLREYTPHYNTGWRSAIRSVAARLGVYEQFAEALEAVTS